MKSTIYDWMKMGQTVIPNVLLKYFHRLNVTGDEFVLILYLISQISTKQKANQIDQISLSLGWHQQKIFEHLNSLMDKDYLSIELMPDNNGKQADHYTLRPLFEKLDSVLFQSETEKKEDTIDTSIVAVFENEFGRVLSPIELEVLNNWLITDKYNEDLIKLALKQAVLNQALSFKYIDAILLNWEKGNIRTVREAEKQIEQFQQKTQQKSQFNQDTSDDSKYDHFEIPIYKWDKSNKNNG